MAMNDDQNNQDIITKIISGKKTNFYYNPYSSLFVLNKNKGFSCPLCGYYNSDIKAQSNPWVRQVLEHFGNYHNARIKVISTGHDNFSIFNIIIKKSTGVQLEGDIITRIKSGELKTFFFNATNSPFNNKNKFSCPYCDYTRSSEVLTRNSYVLNILEHFGNIHNAQISSIAIRSSGLALFKIIMP